MNARWQSDTDGMLEAAKQRGFLLTRRDGPYHTYRNWCYEQRLPLVVIRPKVRYAQVTIDLTPAGRVFNRKEGAAFESYLNGRIKRGTRNWQSSGGPRDYTWYYIPIADAQEIAVQLARLAMEHSTPEPPEEPVFVERDLAMHQTRTVEERDGTAVVSSDNGDSFGSVAFNRKLGRWAAAVAVT